MGEAMSEVEYAAADSVLAQEQSALDKEAQRIMLRMHDIVLLLKPGVVPTGGQEVNPRELKQELDALEKDLDGKQEAVHELSDARENLYRDFEENKRKARMQR